MVFDATGECVQYIINQVQQRKGQGVMGTITGCGQQANESTSVRGEIDGYEITEGYDWLEATERLTLCPNQTRARLPSSTVYY